MTRPTTRRTARPRRALPLLTAAAVLTTGLVAPGATAAPAAPATPAAPDDHPWPSLADVEGWPQQHRLREPADDPADVSPTYGSLPYDDIAPALNDLQRRSDRVSVEVVGRSTQGRDLYRVVVTAPRRTPRRGSRRSGGASCRTTPRPRRPTRSCSPATRRRSSSTATSTATSGRAPTRPSA